MRIIRPSECSKKTGLHRKTCLRKGRDRNDPFPAPVDLGLHSVGFIEHEVDDWIEKQVAKTRGKAA